MDIPLCKPYLGKEELSAVKEVLDSGWLAHGPKTKEFEKNFAEYIGTKHAFALNSAASALQVAIQALGLKGEIILPSFTFSASANAVVNASCKPVFAETDYKTGNIDPEDIKKRITDKTVAIMPVYFAGQSCDMKKVMEIAEEHNLRVIEDSAECTGGEFNNQKTGTFGIGCFSFYPVKNMTTGEGGMITTNDDSLKDKINALKGHGILSSAFEREKKERPWVRSAILPGYNFRMSDINAAVGVVQLKKLDKMNQMRRNNASYLNERIKPSAIELPIEQERVKHVYQMYTIKLPENVNRKGFIDFLKLKGVQASVHFDPPVHLQQYYMKTYGYKKGDFPITEKLSERIVTLPMFPQLKKEEMDYMVDAIEEFFKKR